MSIHQLTATLLLSIKWPTALAAICLLPAALWALWRQINQSLTSMVAVMASTLIYLLIWRAYLRHQSMSAFSTLEHELNHALFALLTGNRVNGLKVTLRNGGHMNYEGTPNWLIDVAPYFVPLATLIVMLASLNVPALQGLAGKVLLGLTLGYHLTAGWTQLHPAQTDLQKAGFLFCGLFLPTANICSLGLTLAFAHHQWIPLHVAHSLGRNVLPSLLASVYEGACPDFVCKAYTDLQQRCEGLTHKMDSVLDEARGNALLTCHLLKPLIQEAIYIARQALAVADPNRQWAQITTGES